MSRGLNKVMLIGNVGADPDVRTTQGGTRVAKVSLATERRWTDKGTGEVKEKTEWHRLTFWGNLATIVEQHVQKGDRLYVEGRIEYSQTEDQQTGVTRYWTDINVAEMVMLGSPSGRQNQPQPDGPDDSGQQQYPSAGRSADPQQDGPAPNAQGDAFDPDDDDLPF